MMWEKGHKKLLRGLGIGVASVLFASTFSITSFAAGPFNASFYASRNPDVVASYGLSIDSLRSHYSKYGKKEGRAANPTEDPTFAALLESAVTPFGSGKGLDAIFDAAYYAKNNPSVVEILGNNPETLYNHFVNYGIFEGRSPSAKFNVKLYKAAYSDLSKAFGDSLALYYLHYAAIGMGEGRTEPGSKYAMMNSAGSNVLASPVSTSSNASTGGSQDAGSGSSEKS